MSGTERSGPAPILTAANRGQVQKLGGTALLWVGLAAVSYVPTSDGGLAGAAVSLLGFLAFAAGIMLFGDGLKRQVVEELRRDGGPADVA
jgi:hypothetical protein